MKKPSEKEVAAVLHLDGAGRVRHFVKVVADYQEVWGLWDDGWAIMQDDAEHDAVPLWPAEAYALFLRQGSWSSYEVDPEIRTRG